MRGQPPKFIPKTEEHIAEIRRRVIRAGFFLHLVVMGGTAGYYILGGGNWSFIDCLYMTVITLTTVGYTEILPLWQEPAMRVFTIALIAVGMGLVLYFVSTLTAMFVDGSMGLLFVRRKMIRKLSSMRDHYVVCGLGKTGMHVLEELVETSQRVVVLDSDEERIEAVRSRFGDDVVAMLGDATSDDDLTAIGIDRATGLVVSLGEDVDNLYCTLSARELAEKVHIIVVSDNIKVERKFIHAGADAVVYPAIIGGRRIASQLIRPGVVSFLDVMLRERGRTLRIEEVHLPKGSHLDGKRLHMAGIREFGDALVIGVRPGNGGEQIYNPGPQTELSEGDTLIVLGELTCIDKIKEFAAKT